MSGAALGLGYRKAEHSKVSSSVRVGEHSGGAEERGRR